MGAEQGAKNGNIGIIHQIYNQISELKEKIDQN